MDNLPDIGGNLEDIITQTLARRRKRMEDVSPEWGVDLSPEQVGATASGEPITMDAPTVRRTEDLPPGFVRDGARMTGPSGAYTELGTPRIVRKGSPTRTEVAADGAELSPLMAQLVAIKGPGEVMTPESVQAAKQAYAARGGEFARGTLPTVEAAKAGEDARQRDLMERLERQAQGAADTSKATSSDGPPDTEPLYRQAFLEQLRNVGRAARGEQTVRVASPELAARDELAKWLAGKREREAGAAKLAQEERLEQMRALLGLAREEAATGRTKMQTEADVKRAEIAAGAKAAPKGAAGPTAPKPAKPPKDAVELDEEGNIVPSTLAAARLAMKKAAVSAPRGYKVGDPKLYGGQAFQDVEQAREFRKALGAVRALKNHREHAMTALETMRKARFPSKEFDTALGVLNQQLNNVAAKLRASEGLPNTEGMQHQVDEMLSLTHGSAANLRNFMNTNRLAALMDSAVESADTNLGSLEETANIVKEAGGEKKGEHGAVALAPGHVVLVDENGDELDYASEESAAQALKSHPNWKRR